MFCNFCVPSGPSVREREREREPIDLEVGTGLVVCRRPHLSKNTQLTGSIFHPNGGPFGGIHPLDQLSNAIKC